MIRLIYIAILSVLLLSCADSSKANEEAKSNVKYEIIKDDKKHNIRRSIDIMLKEKITSEAIENIALIIKNADPDTYERTFIGYYIEGSNKKDGFWATSHFDPKLKIKIHGLSVEEEKLLTVKEKDSSDKIIIGSWLDDRPYMKTKLVLYKKSNKVWVDSIRTGSKSEPVEMTQKNINGTSKFEEKEENGFGEYYIVNDKSELEFWSKSGRYYITKILDK